MPRKWTIKEENEKRKELEELYIKQGKVIGEIAKILKLAESSVYDRMIRLGIPTDPKRKINYYGSNRDKITLPSFSNELAEFCGIMLGDGHISPFPGQIYVYINPIADADYISYVEQLLEGLFKIKACRYDGKNKATIDLFITSVDLIAYLAEKVGLSVSNKVKEQVGIPSWIYKRDSYKNSFIRGFFDTDGSIYKLKFGVQMSFCNRSFPLLNSTREILLDFGYNPSKISCCNVYLTRKSDLMKYALEIGFGNSKHYKRALKFGVLDN